MVRKLRLRKNEANDGEEKDFTEVADEAPKSNKGEILRPNKVIN